MDCSSAQDFLDLRTFPIDSPGTARFARMLEEVHTGLADKGCAVLKGRHTLHRVSAATGNRTRYVGILSFPQQPGMVASPERCRQLYGRVLPIHFARGGQRADWLLD